MVAGSIAVTAPVHWDPRERSLVVGEPCDEHADGVALLSFTGLVWLTFDSDGRPMSVDLHDVPDELAVVVPRALRPRFSWNSTERDNGSSWLLDTDSGWVWIRLTSGMAHRRLIGAADVLVWLRDGAVVALRLALDDDPAAGGAPSATLRQG
ncbi:hypothetical protein P3T36_002034 [Kitasatospora sp. MAP12-15]|uniref:hypothetical protein n=1 Tax=unclassified Kitasatospora TaxID=2633591 RepID=UPI002475F0B3|nr:hypothetical protein [Kitasatospora sp. MAP12-44]MDH6111719.1 hypothetical protein [Kitasatospora sp. MAP12-44]